MTILSKRGDERRTRRADSRKSRQNKLFWIEGPESRRLEDRTLLTMTVTTFPIPLVALMQPGGITKGPDGNLWFTETGADKIGRMTPEGVLTQFPLPAVAVPAGSTGPPPGPTEITAGPDGALWFIGVPGEVGRITTAGVVTEFAVPNVPPPVGSPPGTASTPATLTAITAGPDRALWFTGVPGEVGRITAAGVVTEFAVPAIPPPAGAPAGTASTPATLTSISGGPDGALWFTFMGASAEVGRITTAGVVTEFAVPAIPLPAGLPAGTPIDPATLEAITAGPDGALWFTSQAANALGGFISSIDRITTNGSITAYPLPAGPSVAGITQGPDRALWFTTGTQVGRITTAGVVSEFTVPGNFKTIAGLTSGPGGNLWFTEQEDGTPSEQPALGEITPAGMTKLYALPQGTTLDPNRGVPVDPSVITTGPDGALWFGEKGAIGRITTAGTVQQFPLPATPAWLSTGVYPINSITAGPDSTVWFAVGGEIGRITTAGAITMYPLSPDSTSAYVTAGPDGDVWFTETVVSPFAVGRITAAGQIQTFALPKKAGKYPWAGNITVGPDGNLWFILGSPSKGITGAIGRITATGNLKIYNVDSKGGGDYFGPPAPSDIISGPDGKLWFLGTVDGKEGIARISTSGKLEPVIPVGSISNMVLLPNGQVLVGIGSFNELARSTRSGTVVIHPLPRSSSPSVFDFGGYGNSTIGPDGNLWYTSGASSIVRISGLDTIDVPATRRHGR